MKLCVLALLFDASRVALSKNIPSFDGTTDNDSKMCDPATCGDWNCMQWCYCFDYVPTLAQWFEDNQLMQEKTCPDDGMNLCNCGQFDLNGNGILDEADGNDNGILDELEAFISDKGCCRTCTTGKACGDACINSEKTCSKTSGCACQKVRRLKAVRSGPTRTLSLQRLYFDEQCAHQSNHSSLHPIANGIVYNM